MSDSEYIGPFNIEALEMGVWDSIDVTDSFEFALILAGSYCRTQTNTPYTMAWWTDKRIRIIDANNKII